MSKSFEQIKELDSKLQNEKPSLTSYERLQIAASAVIADKLAEIVQVLKSMAI